MPPVAGNLGEVGPHLVKAQKTLDGGDSGHPLSQPVEGGRDQLERPDKARQKDQRQGGDQHHLSGQIPPGKEGTQHNPEPTCGQQEWQGKQPKLHRICMTSDIVVIEAEAEEVAHRQQEQPRQHQSSGQQQRQHRRALPVTMLAATAALVLGRPQDPRPHQQHLMEDQHEHRRHHVVDVAHGGVEHRHHVEGHRIPAHGRLWQRLAVAQQPRHLHLRGESAAGLRQPLGNGTVDQKVGGITGITQGDALAQHQIPIEVVGDMQDPARLPGHHQLPRFIQRIGPRYQLHLRRGIGHKLQLAR